MEFVVGLLAGAALLIAVILVVVARRSRGRSTLDPSRDAYQGFPDHQTPGPYGQHSDGTGQPGAGGGIGGSF